jgi:hypothetical protein
MIRPGVAPGTLWGDDAEDFWAEQSASQIGSTVLTSFECLEHVQFYS